MADEAKVKLDKANAESFKKTVSQFHESVIMADIASEELKQGGQALQEMKGIWKDEVTAPMKGMVTGFTNMIPGFGLASKLTLLAAKTGWSYFFGAKKQQKKQEKQLLDALGLNKEQLKAFKKEQAKIKAEEAIMANLQKAADDWGLVADNFNLKDEAAKGADADRAHLNETEKKLVDQQLKILGLQADHQKSTQSEFETAFDEARAEDKKREADKPKDWKEEAGPHLKSLLGISEQIAQTTKDWTEEAGPHLKSLLGISEQQLEKIEAKLDKPEVVPQDTLTSLEKLLGKEKVTSWDTPDPKPEADFVGPRQPDKPEVVPQDTLTSLEKREADFVGPRQPDKPEVVPTEGDQGAILKIAEQQKETLDSFVAAATTEGSIYVHDKSVADELDSQGKKTGAAAKEQQNEQRRKDERLVDTLEGIEKNTEELDGIKSDTEKKGKGFLKSLLGGGGLFGGAKEAMASMGSSFLPGGVKGLTALAPKAMAFLKVAGPIGIIVGGVVAAASMVKDGVEGYNKAASGEWPVDKVSGAIGAAIGGTGQGWKNAAKQGLKGAAIGASVGLAFGPVGAIVGGVVGGAVGGIAGFIGGETISKWVDGATKSVRNIFNLPELLTPEQIAASETRLTEIKTEVSTFDTQIESLKEQLKSGNLTGKDRIDAMNTLTKLEADRDKTLEEQAKINRNLSNSNIAEGQARVDRASEEYTQAVKSAQQEKNKLFWIGLRHGKDSEEYQTQLDRYNSTKTWSENAKVKLDEQKVAQQAAQTAHDKTHKTMMGNVRLFWTDFKTSIPSWTDVKKGVGAFLKDPKGTLTTALADWNVTIPSWTDVTTGLNTFLKDPSTFVSDKMKDWNITIPSWTDITGKLKDTAAFKFVDNATDMVTGQLRDWGVPVPTWDEVKTKLASTSASAFNLLDKGAGAVTDKLQDYGVPIPDWKDVKAGVTGFLADPKGTLQGVLNKYDIKLPTWDSVVDGVTGFLNDPKAGLTTAFDTLSKNMPDFVSGAGSWAADKMTAWKTALPSVELPDLSEAMAGISDMASAAKSKITGFFSSLFGAGDEEISARTQEEITKHGQTLKAAKKSGLYDDNWSGDSTINREALQQGVESKMIQKDMLDAIIADEDISKEDLEFMKTLVEQATKEGSLYVHDIELGKLIKEGNDFRLNANKLGAISNVGTSSAGTTNATNVIVNAPTQSAVAHTKVETAIGLSDPYTHLARAY
jgi:hypothetical protein